MATVFDYLKWRGDLSFAQDPLNPVDGLIFCVLSYIPFVGQAAETPNEPIALRDAAADFLSLDDYESRVRAKNDAMMSRNCVPRSSALPPRRRGSAGAKWCCTGISSPRRRRHSLRP